MKTGLILLGLLGLSHAAGFAQTRVAFVSAVGTAMVSVKPDQARIDFTVSTQAQAALDASSRNATQTTNVINALTSLLGPNADIRTVSYSLSPNYTYSSGQPAVLVGYTANNTIEVTAGDLSAIGKIIDTGISAGATQVQAPQFGLKDDSGAKAQALKLATAEAKANADAMASGVGKTTGAVIAIQQGVASTPVTLSLGAAAPNATPIQPGNVNVQATVTIDVALNP